MVLVKAMPSQGRKKQQELSYKYRLINRQLGIEVNDFGKSWRSGVAFHSVIYAIRPDLVDMDKVRMKTNRENLEDAFTVAENELGIPRLLDPEDVDVDKPDEKSIMTYVAQFLKHYPDPHNTETDGQGGEKEDRRMLREVKAWLEQYERDLSRAQVSEGSLQEKYQLFKSFRVQYEMKKKQIEALIQPVQREGKLSVDQALVKQAWEKATARLLEWHIQLDKSLPGPLGAIGAWLHRAEEALREEITVQQAHEETANIIHRKLEQNKEVLKGLEGQKQTFLQIHRAGSVNGVLIPAEQLEDMAQRFHFVSSTAQIHLIKLEFWELKYRLLAFLMLAESMLKSWIIKYGRRESVELLLQNYISFIEENQFFERYEVTYQTLKQTAEVYVKSDGSAEEAEGLSKFLNDTAAQWRNLSVEVRSVRSMLEEVISNWDKYSSTVAGLQAWLEDAEKMLNQPENAQREFFRNLPHWIQQHTAMNDSGNFLIETSDETVSRDLKQQLLLLENAKREFFRNLPHWIQQHTAMNDSGNFLIETSDETVSRDLKQQLLLLNGRWRELFVKVKQYVRADEVDKIRKEYQDGISALKAFLDTANEKMTAPIDVSFLNVRTFAQEVEDIKQKVPVMEAQYKSVTRNAQVLNKDTPQEEASEMLATMTGIKEQLSKIREIYLPLLRESQSLLSPLEETEKQITSFYESVEKASIITAGRDTEAEAPGDFRQQCQELLVCQENCKKSLAVIGKNSQSFQRVLASSKTLQHFDCSMLQKRIDDLQVNLQTMMKEAGEWRKHIEANSSLMKRFEESRIELEKVLNIAQTFLKEKGNPEEVLKKHTSFIEGNQFFERYEVTYQTLKQTAEVYVKSDGSAEEAEGLSKFLNDTAAQWRNLSVEVRSVRSMLEEVISNWDKYSSTVAGLQAWLEDAEKMLNQPENAQREFFRNLPHWIQQHTAMNDSGNFLIETSDETVSRDLKQQLLLLNGRWRELFVKVKQDIKQKVPVMEAQYKSVTRNAQVLNKDTPQEEASEMLATMTGIKEQLSKTMMKEAGEWRKHIEANSSLMKRFEESRIELEKVLNIAQTFLKEKGNPEEVLKKHTTMMKEAGEWRKHIEANSSLMKRFEESRIELEKVLNIAQTFLKEKGNPEEVLKKHTEFFGQLDQRVLNAFLKACDELTDILPEQEQQSLQETVKKLHKQWKDIQTEAPYHLLHLKIEVEETRLQGTLEECRAELARENKALPAVGSEQVIKEHRAFFGDRRHQQLCEKRLQLIDELCQKLPEKDPACKTVESCKKALTDVKSQIDSTYQKLQQHPDKFSELAAWLSAKESQLSLLKNRANDPSKYGQVKSTIETEKVVSTVGDCVQFKEEVKRTLEELVQGQKEAQAEADKILDSESVQEAQQLLLIHQEVRQDAEKKEGSLSWLKSRLSTLIEVSSENEAKRQEGALTKLSSDFKGLLASLAETEKVVSTVGDCVQFKEEVKRTLEELVQGQKEAQAEADKILDSESVQEAQQLLLIHQTEKVVSTVGDCVQFKEEVKRTLEELVQGQKEAQAEADKILDSESVQEAQQLLLIHQMTLSEWQQFDTEKDAVVEFLKRAGSNLERDLTFSSLESLSAELEQTKVRVE
ncbi:UNVERIFIED_CONTAM: hypothetical protein FKN15_005783 [Acipenser sinensis]